MATTFRQPRPPVARRVRPAPWALLTVCALAAAAHAQPTLLADGGAHPGATLQVGPLRAIKTLADAARHARDGDTIDVDAGTYRRDVAVWQRDRLTLRAVGGRVRLLADGASAEGKAIWVVRGGRVSIEGFDFEGSRVEARNGAGIRFEAGQLTVRDCRFVDNEMGLLTSNDPRAELTVENSEFAHNQRPDGHNHNLYAGSIARLTVTGSHLHHASTGHLLKSRAALNHIFYNRLSDGADGSASYELEFPNGGVAVVVGNLIEQSALTQNPIMISYGAEGYRWPANALVLAHNTLADLRPEGGIALRVVPGEVSVRLVNNLVVGNAAPLAAGAGVPADDQRGNFQVGWDAFGSAPPDRGLYRLARSAAVRDQAVDPGDFDGLPLRPSREFSPPRGTRALRDAARQPGAMQRLAGSDAR